MYTFKFSEIAAPFAKVISAKYSSLFSPNTASKQAFKRMQGGAVSAVFSVIVVAALSTAFSACNLLSDPHDDHSDDHDVITTVRMSLTTMGQNDTTDYTWEDIDGIGGNNPNRIDTVFLKAGKMYSGMLSLTNRAMNPAEDLTAKISSEANQHQFFYTLINTSAPSSSLGSVTITDRDGRNLPLGLNFSIDIDSARAGSSGTMRVTLYHYQNTSEKNGTGPASETDLEVSFPVVVR